MKHLILAALLGAFVSTTVACKGSGTADEAPATVTHRLRIEDLISPENCPPRIEGALRRVPGVESAVVDFDRGAVEVVCSLDCEPARLVEAVAKAGYVAALD